MRALLWKDFRVYRPVIVTNLLLIALPYMIVWIVTVSQRSEVLHREIIDNLAGASAWAFALTGLLGCVYGAGAFALERNERSLDFMTILPVQRLQVVISKLLVTGSAILLLQLLCLFLTKLFLAMDEYAPRGWDSEQARIFFIIESASLMLFAIAWLCSTFLRSITISAGVAIVLVATVSATIWFIVDQADLPSEKQDTLATHAQVAIMLIVGVFALIGSSIYYLWRVEP